MDGAKSNKTPMSLKQVFSKDDGSKPIDATLYRSILGALQYLTLTRPDICFAVNKLAQFMHAPSSDHLQGAKRILRYLKGTLNHDILLKSNPSVDITAYTDSDLGGSLDDRRSTTAYIVYMGGNPVSWKSCKQRSVSRSSTEAEYKAIAATCSETTWISNLLSELHLKSSLPTTIYNDNLGANYFSRNPVFHSRMKHLSLDYHFVREKVQNNALRVSHVSTHVNMADLLTKPLPSPRFAFLRTKLGVADAPTSLRGRIKESITQNMEPQNMEHNTKHGDTKHGS